MAKYRKKPVVIEAVHWMTDNYTECFDFCSLTMTQNNFLYPHSNGRDLVIKTLEGEMICSPFDWIIRGVNGEFYPCKPDIFEKTYERVVHLIDVPLPPDND